ncbi:MAG: LicD family protein [Prevotella sp.]|jgi:lipopolysaccharide cholinephosphotransferase
MQEFNSHDEVRSGYQVSAEMKKIWAIQLELLRQLLDVCQANGLRCWVDGGTMLGAVRHHGYIPWDDDLDVCMPRPDYDRLVQIGPSAFQSPSFFQSAYTDVDYFRGHAQLRNSDTTAIRPSESYRKFNQGIFIDIFPLDGVPEDADEARRVVRQSRKIQRLLKAAHLNVLYSGRWLQIFRKYKSKYLIRKYGWENIYKRSEDCLRNTPVESSRYWAELSFAGTDFTYEAKAFDHTEWMDFENMKVPVPGDYDSCLRRQYGDNYMTPIHAVTSHGNVVFDTEHSYKEMAPAIFKAFKQQSVRRLCKKFSK